MKIIVTGGAGFIGSNLVEKLTLQGFDVISWDLYPHPSNGVNSAIVNVLDLDLVKKALAGADVVYHLAGPVVDPCRKEPCQSTQFQIQGTANMLEAARENRIKKFLLASSFYVYDGINSNENVDENSVLDTSKMELFGVVKTMSERLTEICAMKNGFDYSILRFGSTYGFGNCSCVVKDFLDMGLQKKPIVIWGKGHRRNQYTFIDDVVSGCIAAIEGPNDTYNLVSPEETTTASLAELLRDKYDFDIRFETDRNEGPSMAYMSAERAQTQLGWKTNSLEDGLKQMISKMEVLYE